MGKHNAFLDWFDTSTPSKHPVFGKVTEGMDVINAINTVPTGPGDKPKTPVVMEKIEIMLARGCGRSCHSVSRDDDVRSCEVVCGSRACAGRRARVTTALRASIFSETSAKFRFPTSHLRNSYFSALWRYFT